MNLSFLYLNWKYFQLGVFPQNGLQWLFVLKFIKNLQKLIMIQKMEKVKM